MNACDSAVLVFHTSGKSGPAYLADTCANTKRVDDGEGQKEEVRAGSVGKSDLFEGPTWTCNEAA